MAADQHVLAATEYLSRRLQSIFYLICVVPSSRKLALNHLGTKHLCNEIPLPSPLITAGRQAEA